MTDLQRLTGDALVRALKQAYPTVDTAVFAAGRPWRILRPRSAEDLLDDDDFDRDGTIPYWAEVWPSAPVLADRLAARPGRGAALLELGCGVGLLALVAQAAGYRALATDYYPEALDFVRANAWRNDQVPPATRVVDWRRLPADLGRFDRVIAADVLYEPAHADLIVAVLERTLAEGGLALIADPGRPTAARFADRCASRGLAVERVDTPISGPGLQVVIHTYEVRRPT